MSERRSEPPFWNPANALTLSRPVLGAVAWGLIAYGRFSLALGVFLVAALTDALDGWLARRLGLSSAIGRALDPLVDKILIIGTLAYLIPVKHSGVLPIMLAVIASRELVIQWLRSLIEGKGEPFGANAAGKLKTVFQCLGVIASLAGLAFGAAEHRGYALFRDAILWLAAALTLYSGAVYLGLGARFLKSEGATFK